MRSLVFSMTALLAFSSCRKKPEEVETVAQPRAIPSAPPNANVEPPAKRTGTDLAKQIIGKWQSVDATQVQLKSGQERIEVEFTESGEFRIVADGDQKREGKYRFDEEGKLKMRLSDQQTEDQVRLSYDGVTLEVTDVDADLTVKLKKEGTFSPDEVVKPPPRPSADELDSDTDC